MFVRTILVASLAIGAAAILTPVTHAAPCETSGNARHEYVGGGAKPYDSCSLAANGKVGDGDADSAGTAASMPVYDACLSYNFNLLPDVGSRNPPVAHHGFNIAVWDEVGTGTLMASAGTDGPAKAGVLVQTGHDAYTGRLEDDCTGNGIISNDPTTDPADCGMGEIDQGVVSAYPLVYANTVYARCNEPSDGMIWVTILGGAKGTITAG